MELVEPTRLTRRDDSQLLALCERFWSDYREAEVLHSKFQAIREAVEADPDYPPYEVPAVDSAAYEANRNFKDEYGDKVAYNAWNAAIKRAAATANYVFDSPAYTPRGIAAKCFILKLAQDGGDNFVSVYEEESWFDAMVADLERLGEGDDFAPLPNLETLNPHRAAALKMLADCNVSIPMLEREIQAVENRINAGADDDALDRRLSTLQWAIAEAPAKNHQDMAVKVRRWRVSIGAGTAVWDSRLAETLLEGLAE